MKAFERKEEIIKLLHSEKKVTVAQLSASFNVTEETIRRDLEKLEKEGIAKRNHGGAVLNVKNNEDLPYQTRNTNNIEEKNKIAEALLTLIPSKKTIMADPSSSVLVALKRLAAEREELTIISNSAAILQEFNNSKHTIISTGGMLRDKSSSLVGSVARNTIKNYNVDVALFSCKGLSMANGITDSSELDCDLKQQMSKQATTVILLADSSKFDNTGFVRLFDFSEIDYLVTDTKPSDDWLAFLESFNIAVLYPKSDR